MDHFQKEIERIKNKDKTKNLKLQEKICKLETEKLELTRLNETSKKAMRELEAVKVQFIQERENHNALKTKFSNLKELLK